MRFTTNLEDKILLTVIWGVSLGATIFLAYHPPSEPEVLRTMMTLVTSVLSAILILMNITRRNDKGDGSS